MSTPAPRPRLTSAEPEDPAPARPKRDSRAVEILSVLFIGLVLAQRFLIDLLDVPLLQTWSTLFVSINIQALPFLVLGVTVSGAIAAFLSANLLARIVPRNDVLAVGGATAAGFLLPGCECGSVPISERLIARGVAPAAALAFMLSAPAINPVVLVSTAVAFPGQPRVVVARLFGSVAAALLMGLVWLRRGNAEEMLERARKRSQSGDSRLETFVATVRHDFLHAGGYLVIGAAVAATLQVVVPRNIVDAVAGNELLAIAAMATLAVVLSICSEADAFVAASFGQFSLTSRLVFLVVGPVVDLKLVALQAGIFGRAFARRFAPTAFGVAVATALLAGTLVL